MTVVTQVDYPSGTPVVIHLPGWQLAGVNPSHDGSGRLAQPRSGLVHGDLCNSVPGVAMVLTYVVACLDRLTHHSM